MKHTRALLLSIAGVLLSFDALAQTAPSLRVDDAKIQASFEAGRILVTIPIVNRTASPVSAWIQVDLVDPGNAVVASDSRKAEVPLGRFEIVMSLPSGESAREHDDRQPWQRLRYRVGRDGETEALADGVFALAAIAPDLFELRAVHSSYVLPGQTHEVRVYAINPVTNRPVSGVMVRGAIGPGTDAQAKAIPSSQTTGAEGEALLRFTVSGEVARTDREIVLEGRKGGQVRRRTLEITPIVGTRLIVNTDKRLYQPGETLRARVLVFNERKQAVAHAAVRFTLWDPDGGVVLRGDAVTNEFGIASGEWPLPEDTRLGDYPLDVASLQLDGREDSRSSSRIAIRRYDLPTFTVSAALDRPYYLPGQNAEVDVSAMYLFGQPVPRGAIRVARETTRTWNFRGQKWDITEQDVQTGALSPSGHARFTLNLGLEFAAFEPKSFLRSRDITYAVFVTDASTGRTEQRRFLVRISHDPIHVYTSGMSRIGDSLSFYVTTCYPDGSPAEVEVQVGRLTQPGAVQPLRSVTTNRYGAAKVSKLALGPIADPNDVTIVLEAIGKNGARSRHDESRWWLGESQVEVSTDKTLYRSGEPIEVAVHAVSADSVILDVGPDGAVHWSTRIQLRAGEGSALVPYQPEFIGEVHVTAYSIDGARTSDRVLGQTHSVMFPHDTELRVTLRSDRTSYRPGDEVTASIHVDSSSGAPQRSALGVVVVDQAVEERFRTDEDFGQSFVGFWDWGWWFDRGSLGGLTLRDIAKLDLAREFPEGVELVAEVLLNQWQYPRLPDMEGYDYGSVTASLFRPGIELQLRPLREALEHSQSFPMTGGELAAVVTADGRRADSLKDPWGRTYRYRSDLVRDSVVATAMSAGPDGQFDTDDDIRGQPVYWKYFTPIGTLMNRVIERMSARSGACVRDFQALTTALLSEGVDLVALRDPWGAPYAYHFDVVGVSCQVVVRSHGSSTPSPSTEPFTVWTTRVSYFAESAKKLDEAASASVAATGRLPRSDEELDNLLRKTGFRLRELRDPWGRPYYVTYPRGFDYGDQLQFSSLSSARQVTPVTRALAWVRVWSAGPDGAAGTSDDVLVASNSQLVSERAGRDSTPRPKSFVPPLRNGTGALEGEVKDSSGGVIPGVQIVVKVSGGTERYLGLSGANGRYLIRDVTAGQYDVEAALPGFIPSTIREVPVVSGTVTAVNLTLEVGSLSEAVTVRAGPEIVQTQSAASLTFRTQGEPPQTPARPQIATPRLREFFPETLYWEPSLITDESGTTSARFKLADSITAWKMSVVASTANGEIGTADTGILAFQPFFIEHDPPKVLTIGDAIDLPVVIRSYVETPQLVDVSIKPVDWFRLMGPASQKISVPAGGSERVVFPFLAMAATSHGQQQVSAVTTTVGDRIEKPVRVHPNGQEQSVTTSQLFGDTATVSLDVPTDLIGDTLHATVKVYPNLLAHVVDSIEGSLQRPHGCAEQIISAAYPSLMLLKYYKDAHVPASDVAGRAEQYVKEGIQRVLGYRMPNGSFSYWARGDPDIPLTAYAARFLSDASDLARLDQDDVVGALEWLVSTQQKDGRWSAPFNMDDSTTAYVSRTLWRAAKRLPEGPSRAKIEAAAKRGLQTLQSPLDPYALALYALAEWESGSPEAATSAAVKLRSLAHREGTGTYWALESNTLFHGWGFTGRLETTAAVVTALSVIDGAEGVSRDLVGGGITFLLKNKDRFGVWYSGQATVTVLDALFGVLRVAQEQTTADNVTLVVNGQPGPSLALPPSTAAAAPLSVDITPWVRPGANSIEFRHAGAVAYSSVQAIATFFVPWKQRPGIRESVLTGDTRALRLAVDFAQTSVQVGDTVQCTVDVERIGHRGYGMMLAEVGLPPGSDVDRASLEAAVAKSGWGLSRFDIEPDRVAFYVWPRAGGTKFTFAFRPRFPLKARTAPSMLYDYYNPESQVVLPPVDFDVRPANQAATPRTSPRETYDPALRK